MTTKELIAKLKADDPKGTRIVIMSRDSEGNGYSPLADISTGAYVADSTWSGEVGLEELDDEARKEGYTEDDVKLPEDGAVPCLVLHPVN